jgi:hypothetical protein
MGDTDRETVEVEGPAYYVSMPKGMPDFCYPADEYPQAFESATGVRIEGVDGEHEDESRISIIDFDGTAEVPVVDV